MPDAGGTRAQLRPAQLDGLWADCRAEGEDCHATGRTAENAEVEPTAAALKARLRGCIFQALDRGGWAAARALASRTELGRDHWLAPRGSEVRNHCEIPARRRVS